VKPKSEEPLLGGAYLLGQIRGQMGSDTMVKWGQTRYLSYKMESFHSR
jgi:hypothetical protein